MLGGRGELSRKQHNQKIYSQSLTGCEGRDRSRGGAVALLTVSVVCVIAVRALWLQEPFAVSAPWTGLTSGIIRSCVD